MILRMPHYCKDFRCIADKCSDNCCIGWEIDIDDETAEHYNSIEGEFGERLKANISFDDTSSFILDEKERCPFLNINNLCDIITNLGENSLCQICSDHPRYYEWFNDVKEGGIGLCCEEAARIILSNKAPFEYFDTEIPIETCDDYDAEFYTCLDSARTKIISHLQETSISFNARIINVITYAELLQFSVEDGSFDVPDITSSNVKCGHNLKGILDFMLTLEPINENWTSYLKSCISMYDRVKEESYEFKRQHKEVDEYLQNISIYFVWRHFIKGVFDGDFLSKIKFAAISVAVIKYLFCCKWLENYSLTLTDCIEIAKNYSKEIEYSEENLLAFDYILNQSKEFDTSKICGLFC